MIEKRTCPNCQDNILIATKTTIRGVKDVAAAEDEGVSVGVYPYSGKYTQGSNLATW